MTGEVQTELKRILADIREKTGVDVRLFPQGGDELRFPLDYCGMHADAYVAGTDEGAKQTAGLVAYLVANADLKQILPEREEYLKSILLGEGGKAYAYRFLTKYNIADGACYALDILPERLSEEAAAHIEACLSDSADQIVQMDSARLAAVIFSDDAQSPVELGQFLSQSLYEELGVKASVGIGCEVRSFTEIATSYNQAATAVRMSGIFRSKGDVHTYREFLLVKMLEDVPESKLKEYMEQFRIGNAAEVFADEEMTGTAEEFLENSLNISETSRNLFMHRNTLMYRLDKIERITGLNIRNFSDAVTFRVITILHRLLHS